MAALTGEAIIEGRGNFLPMPRPDKSGGRHVSSLHSAAIELIPSASLATIRAVLRMLLDETSAPAADLRQHTGAAGTLEKAKDRHGVQQVSGLPNTPQAAERTTRPARHRGANRRSSATAKLGDSEWSDLKARIRAAMTERGVKYGGLGEATGFSEATIRNGVSRLRPPSASMVTRLRAWLDQAPAVATGATFPADRRNGASAAA